MGTLHFPSLLPLYIHLRPCAVQYVISACTYMHIYEPTNEIIHIYIHMCIYTHVYTYAKYLYTQHV